jgi:hypothetical protein
MYKLKHCWASIMPWKQCFFKGRNIARWQKKNSRTLILAIIFQKLIFLSPKFSSNLTFFIQIDHSLSIWAIFHQIMMIPSKIWTKVLHFLFHWCHTLDKWKFVEKTLFGRAQLQGMQLKRGRLLQGTMHAQTPKVHQVLQHHNLLVLS